MNHSCVYIIIRSPRFSSLRHQAQANLPPGRYRSLVYFRAKYATRSCIYARMREIIRVRVCLHVNTSPSKDLRISHSFIVYLKSKIWSNKTCSYRYIACRYSGIYSTGARACLRNILCSICLRMLGRKLDRK